MVFQVIKTLKLSCRLLISRLFWKMCAMKFERFARYFKFGTGTATLDKLELYRLLNCTEYVLHLILNNSFCTVRHLLIWKWSCHEHPWKPTPPGVMHSTRNAKNVRWSNTPRLSCCSLVHTYFGVVALTSFSRLSLSMHRRMFCAKAVMKSRSCNVGHQRMCSVQCFCMQDSQCTCHMALRVLYSFS